MLYWLHCSERKIHTYYYFSCYADAHTLGIFKVQSNVVNLYALLMRITRESLMGLCLLYMQNRTFLDYFLNAICNQKALKAGIRRKQHNMKAHTFKITKSSTLHQLLCPSHAKYKSPNRDAQIRQDPIWLCNLIQRVELTWIYSSV